MLRRHFSCLIYESPRGVGENRVELLATDAPGEVDARIKRFSVHLFLPDIEQRQNTRKLSMFFYCLCLICLMMSPADFMFPVLLFPSKSDKHHVQCVGNFVETVSEVGDRLS